MKKVLSIGLLLAVLLCTISSAQASGVNLAYKYKAGEVCRYKAATTMCMGIPGSNSPMKTHMSWDITEKVLAVRKDGSIKLQLKFINMKSVTPGAYTGQSTKKLPDRISTITISKYGKLLSPSNNSWSLSDSIISGDLSSIMSSISHHGLFLPGRAISIGTTCKQVVPIPDINSRINVFSRLIAVSVPFGKLRASKIKQSINSNMDLATVMAASMNSGTGRSSFGNIKGSMNVSGSTVFHFSAAQGKLLNSHGSFKVVTRMIMPQLTRKHTCINSVSTVTTSITKQ